MEHTSLAFYSVESVPATVMISIITGFFSFVARSKAKESSPSDVPKAVSIYGGKENLPTLLKVELADFVLLHLYVCSPSPIRIILHQSAGQTNSDKTEGHLRPIPPE